MKKREPRRVIEVTVQELKAILERVKEVLDEEEYAKLEAAIETLAWLTGELGDEQITRARLRELLREATRGKKKKSEKTKKVIKAAEKKAEEEGSGGKELGGEKEKQKRKGHGRNGHRTYEGAERIRIGHESLKRGDSCPSCRDGKVYDLKDPRVLVRVRGQAPLQARVYELGGLRCHLCGVVHWAKAPEGVGEEKYDASAGSMIGMLKYGTGMPFNRLEKLEGNLGIPLPAATQWEIVEEVAGVITPAHEELIRQAAQGEILHNDDTGMPILELMKENERIEAAAEQARTGMFTTGIVAQVGGRKIALYFTGRKHAGENLADVLKERAAELGAPIQMCDGLDRNLPKDFETVLSNCLSHARRYYVDVVRNFPEECRYVLERLAEVYRNDAITREQKMSAAERLRFHQAGSQGLMDEIESWMTKQIDEKKVEPNSGLGRAISYMQKRWDKLTLFLRKPGAPLDNNICERALKKVVLHRKNAYFYKTENGARVGDIFMSLIHTAELAGVNAFHYLTELQLHADEVRSAPHKWMPWNYPDTIARPPP